jgi:hypothetical protein
MKRRIRVDVKPGMFSSERFATFETLGKNYTVIVDASALIDNTLEVKVISENQQEAIIDLPGETFTSGNRIRVAKNALLAT